jgi:alpha-glucosidase
VAVFARRSGQRWFVGVVNGAEARSVRIPFSFLPKGVCSALLVKDADITGPAEDRLLTSVATNGPMLKIERLNFKRSDTLKLQLQAGGGFVASFDK